MLAMTELIHVGSVIAAFIGTCCTFGDWRQRFSWAWLPGVIAFVSMFDVMVGESFLPPAIWSLLLVVLAIGAAAQMRFMTERAMVLHRSLGLLAMAGAMACMSSPAAASASTHGSSHHDVTSLFVPMALVFSLVVAVLSSWVGFHAQAPQLTGVKPALARRKVARRHLLVQKTEVWSMTISIVFMSSAVLLH